ncbi:MAG: hypothetical protein DWQ02_16095 [Bacteroidetes bacterium]|nr:MAG: hypothetical protein DWQ02_16095 [Bacteroidota bacterium]
MPFFQLSENDTSFPPAHFADMEGMIAIGGDLSAERVLNAYGNGIYFWFGPMDPLKWWSPDPRLVFFTSNVEASITRESSWRLSLDEAFETLMRKCQEVQNSKPMNEYWITEEMAAMYLELFEQGKAHSAEVWEGEEMIGGLFGISQGHLFFVEYLMTADQTADTFALEQLAKWLGEKDFPFIDLQKIIEDTGDIEIDEISRLEYLDYISKNNTKSDLPIPWKTTT